MNRSRWFRRLSVVAISLLLAGLLPATATAVGTTYVSLNTHHVGGSCGDPDYNTIQDAVTAATTGDTVHVCPGLATLAAPVTIVSKNLTFEGDLDGARNSVINGGGLYTIFSTNAPITINDLTLQDASGAAGGAIVVTGGGAVSVTRSMFVGNSATAGSHGGAINAPGSAVVVANSTFSTNTAANGAAIQADTVTITSSTFYNNSASGGATVTAGNAGAHSSVISDSTFDIDTAAPGSPISAVSADLTNTILSTNGSGTICPTPFNDLGGNFSTDGTCGFGGFGNSQYLLSLQPLVDNGGPTDTVALGYSSMAKGAGVDPCPTYDQRGYNGTVGGCDSGAFEAQFDHIKIGPQNASVPLSQGSETYDISNGYDWYDNFLDYVPATFTIDGSDCGGPFKNICSFSTRGDHTIVGSYTAMITMTATTTLHVTAETTTTTVSLTSGSQPSAWNTPVTFGAHVSSSGGTPTGNIQFFDGVTSLGTQALDGSGNASVTTSTLSVGVHSTIHAVYAGTVDFATSTSTSFSHTVSKADQTVTFTSGNPSPVRAGSANYTPTATATSGLTPVIALDGTSTGCTLVAGIVHFTAVGTCKINGTQAGNGNYNVATPDQQVITVSQATTTTTLTLMGSENPSNYGDSLTFTVHVTDGLLTPSGSVELFDGSTSLGTSGLNGSGDATFTPALAGGLHTLHAVYIDSTNFQTSTSTDVPHTVDQADQTVSFTSSNPTPVHVGAANYTPTGTATSGLTPAFTLDSSSTGCTFDGTNVHFVHVGTCIVDANQVGDTNWDSASQVQQSMSVTQATTTTTVTLFSGPSPSTYGMTLVFKAHVADGLATPGGSVEFFDGATSLGVRALSLGDATLTIANLTGGPHTTIHAVYTATTDFGGSTSTNVSQTIDLAAPNITVDSSNASAVYGTLVTFTAHVNSGVGTPTGNVQFFDGVTSLGTVALNGSGIATVSTSGLTVGDHTNITVHYAGDADFLGGTSPAIDQLITGSAVTTTTVGTSGTPSTYGSSVTFTATVAGAGVAPTGSVEFFDNGVSLGTNTLNGLSPDQASVSIATLAAGDHPNITAGYGGDSNYEGSSSLAMDQLVSKATPTTTVGTSGSPSTFGGSVTFTATVGSVGAGAIPTGTVDFFDGVTALGSHSLDGTGHASVSVSSLGGGDHPSITAHYLGDGNYNASLSAGIDQLVNRATPTIGWTSTAPSSAFVGGPTYSVSAADASPVAIVISIDPIATSVCSFSAGIVSLTAAGNCVIDANQAANGDWNAAAQVQQSFSVGERAAIAGLVLSPAVQTITAGASQSYTATAHDAYANTWDATPSTVFSISGGGSCFGASCASSVAGDHTVTGTYSGQSGQATLHVIPAPATQLTVGGLGSPRAIGLFGNLSVTAFDQYGNLATNYTGTIHFTSNDGTAKLPANSTLSSGAGTFSVAFQTVGTWWVTATDTVTGSITGSQLGIVATTPTPATYYALTPARILDSRDGTGGLSGAFSSHVARTFQVPISVVPAGATAVTGNLTVTSQTSGGFLFMGPLPMNDPTSSTLNFPVGDDRANAVTVALGAGGTLSVTYVGSGPSHSAHAIFDVTGYFMPDNSGATFHALAPARILDSRGSTGGMPGKFTSHVARTFQVSSRGNVPANATAVTGNLTVTGQTANGYLYIGPVPKNNPTSSTLNFPFADDRANAVTVALGAGGALSVTYVGPGASQGAYVIFDVTGYFTQDLSGAKYVPLTPARILDSRDNTGGLPGAFGSHTARTFYVAGRGGVLTNATAVTGNLTVTGQTANGFFFIGPNPTNDPTSSTLNFPAGDDRANAVTVALGTGGTLSVTLVGRTAYAIFDVTGYFVGP